MLHNLVYFIVAAIIQNLFFSIFTPPDIHVGGLIFYHRFFLSSFFFFTT